MKSNQTFHSTEAEDVLKGLFAGLAGGLAGSAAMELFQKAWAKVTGQWGGDDEPGKHNEQRGGQPQQRHAESDEPATVKTAEAISTRIFGHELSEPEKEIAGPAVHYTYGGLMGGLYGAAAEAMPVVTLGAGTAYGTALFAIGDEIAVPALGLSKPPTQHPPSTHVYAFVSHLVYGLTLEIVRRGLRRVL